MYNVARWPWAGQAMQMYRAILPYVSPTYAAAYLLPKNAQRYNDEIVEIWFRRLGDGSAGRWVERMVAYLAWPALSVLAISCDLLIFCGFVMWLIATHAVALSCCRLAVLSAAAFVASAAHFLCVPKRVLQS